MKDCLFCRIARGEIEEHVVYEDDDIMAFLDISPIRPGHTQIIPKVHSESFDEMDPALATQIVLLGQRLARVQKRIYDVDRVAFAFSGADIPHTHAHVFPLHDKGDMTSLSYIETRPITWRNIPRPPVDELQSTAGALRAGLEGIGT